MAWFISMCTNCGLAGKKARTCGSFLSLVAACKRSTRYSTRTQWTSEGNCSYCRADEYYDSTLLFPRIWLVRLWQLPWPLGNQPPHSAPCQPKFQSVRYINWWEGKDRYEMERGEERPEVVLGPGGRWKSRAWYAMHNPSNGPWREFRKRIALKEHLWGSEGVVMANCDKDKNHGGSDCPYLYISLQEWAAGSKMKRRVK